MRSTWLAITFGLVICVGALRAQPTITSITNESGESFLCLGGVAFVRGGIPPSQKLPTSPSVLVRPML
jgi:hypothetical protein